MNEIMRLKKHHSAPSTNTICEVINQRISATDASLRESELRLAEDQQKIEDLSRQLSIVKDKLDDENKILDEKAKQLKTEKEKLIDLENEKKKILKNNYDLQRKIQKLRIIKPNISDQNILEHGQKKFALYKELTGIRWDYGVLEQETKGLVTDKKNYLHTFCYPKDMAREELSDLLWKEIQLSTGKKLQDDQDKENALANTQ